MLALKEYFPDHFNPDFGKSQLTADQVATIERVNDSLEKKYRRESAEDFDDLMSSTRHCIFKDGEVVPAKLFEWSSFLSHADRRVAATLICEDPPRFHHRYGGMWPYQQRFLRKPRGAWKSERCPKAELINVSTVFVGMGTLTAEKGSVEEACNDIFETMIFGGHLSDCQWRYVTLEDAKAGHLAAVLLAQQSNNFFRRKKHGKRYKKWYARLEAWGHKGKRRNHRWAASKILRMNDLYGRLSRMPGCEPMDPMFILACIVKNQLPPAKTAALFLISTADDSPPDGSTSNASSEPSSAQ